MPKELCNNEDHDFVEFGYSPIGLSYYCSKCSKVKIPDKNNPLQIQERHFPINFVFQRANWDCSVAVLAMALDISYEEILESCRGYLDPVTLQERGMMQAFLYVRKNETFSYRWKEGEVPTTYELNKYWNADKILIVGIMPFENEEEVEKTDTEIYGHVCIFYDGFIYCPNFGVVEANQYFGRVNYGIVSMISFPR
jgi:hypothetical protein